MHYRITNFFSGNKKSLLLSLAAVMILYSGCSRIEEDHTSQSKVENAIQSGEDETIIAKKGHKIKVQYVGRLADGTIFDQKSADDPLEFILGEGQIIPGFNDAVTGMRLNEEKTVTIKARDAYGRRQESLVREFPRSSIPPDIDAKIGQNIQIQDDKGRIIPGKIVSMSPANVTIDFNHPLANKDLIFDIKLVGVE